MKIEVRGIDDVERLLTKIAPNHANNIMRATVTDVAKQVANDARKDMPEDEGDMIAATKHKRERSFPGRYRATVRVGKDAFYWRFLEYGQGPDRVAHGFFASAMERMRRDLENIFLRSFGKKFTAAVNRAQKRARG